MLALIITLITLDPAHFHASLVQRELAEGVSPVAYVYAPEGADLDRHLALVDSFGKRAERPAKWDERVYRGADWFEKFKAAELPAGGKVVVLAGRNDRKIDYALAALEKGCHVLADKPLVIDEAGYAKLEKAVALAKARKLAFADIMTERKAVLSRRVRELVADRELFGELVKGTPEQPAVEMTSVHHFLKKVNGADLKRPAWYYDVRCQGEAIMDVTTHLVDTAHWTVFPSAALSPADVEMVDAYSSPVAVTLAEYSRSTGLDAWPEYLKRDLDANGVLQCRARGGFTYRVRGVAVKMFVDWRVEAAPGKGDSFLARYRGTKAAVELRGSKIVLVPNDGSPEREIVPTEKETGHETHFAKVAGDFFGWIAAGGAPEEHYANLLVKYRTLALAYRRSR